MPRISIFHLRQTAITLAIVCGFILLVPSSPLHADADVKKTEKATGIHQLTLRGTYAELPYMSFDPTAVLMGGGAKLKSYYRLARHVDELADKDDVQILVLDLSEPHSLSRVQIRDLSRRISQLHEKGKKTIAWLENADTPQVMLASACNEIYLTTDGLVDIPSSAMGHAFFKDLFDLAGVRISTVRAGDFKGAVEPFTRSTMSDHLREHYVEMLTSMNSATVEAIASSRKLSKDKVRAMQKDRVMLPETAKSYGLVDHLVEPASLRKTISARVGGEINWSEPKKIKPKPIGFGDLLQAMMGSGSSRKTGITKPSIVVYHLSGMILDGHKKRPGMVIDGPVVKDLKELRENEHVKGVVIRVNSPGGSATASESIRVAIADLAAEKPVAFSMGDVAASGGYLVACADARIFADADTITGSIGVFGLQTSFAPLMRRVGVNTETVALDAEAKMLRGQPWTEEELAKLQSHVDQIYDLFLDRVSKARSIPVEKLQSMAGGRIWTGSQAKKLGLVDEIGGLTACVNTIKIKSKAADAEVKHLPEVKDGLDLSELFGETGKEIYHDELSKRLYKLRALGFDTRPLEFLLQNAMQSQIQGNRIQAWTLQPMNFTVR